MLYLEAVGKRYRRGRWIFRDVDLAVGPGEIVAITGGNGSGKSTLLRVLVGLSVPTSGAVRGRPAVVGYVPERFPPGERLSALAYLTHLGRIRGLSTKSALRRADELLERLALVGGKDAPLRTLSAGNAQKVAVAQALLVPPRLLVLDEPWSGLDASAHGVLDEIVGEVARDGGGVVFTDHQEPRVRVSAGYEMEGGRLARRAIGAVVEVVLRPPPDGRGGVSDLSVMAGVHDAAASGGLVTVRVARSVSDAWLMDVLRQGWSVVALRSDAAAP